MRGRPLKLCSLFTLCCLASGPLSAAGTALSEQSWDFRAFLDGDSIGTHNFRLLSRDRQHDLHTEADFEVKLWFIKAYSYQHRNRERWEGDCLQRIDASTDDNGELYSVQGEREADGFVVQTGDGQQRLPACIMSFAYWNPKILEASRLLNTQTGEYLAVQVEHEADERLEVAGREVPTRRYRLQARDMTIWLWYDEQERWVALRSLTEGGRYLDYRLEAPSGVQAAAP